MKVANKDFLVVEKSGKRLLLRVASVEEEYYICQTASISIKSSTEDEDYEVYPEEVLANLGKSPRVGSAYGIKVLPIFDKFVIEGWGHAYIMDRPLVKDTGSRDKLVTAFSKAHKKLNKINCTQFIPIDLVFRPEMKNTLGMYQFSRKRDRDIMYLMAPTWKDSGKTTLLHTIFHESAHGLIYRAFSPKQLARWVRAYHSYVNVHEIQDSIIKGLTKQLMDSDSLKEWNKESGQETKKIRSCILRYIREIHRISTKDLDVLLKTQDFKTLKTIVPSPSDLTPYLSDIHVPVTDYAAKNVHEMICESFALWMLESDSLDTSIVALCEKTFPNLNKRND